MSKLNEIQSILQYQPECHSVIPSLWYSSKYDASPIWIKISYQIKKNIKTVMNSKLVVTKNRKLQNTNSTVLSDKPVRNYDWNKLMSNSNHYIDSNNIVYSQCITALLNLWNITEINYSNMKSVKSSEMIFW